ncbi:MAG: hypothetical protein U1D55_02460 [Phycisphaerae bacterium]
MSNPRRQCAARRYLRSSACSGLPIVIAALAGCAANPAASQPADSPLRAKVRVHLASTQAHEGYEERKDERGAAFFVNPTPELTEDDVESAVALHGKSESFIQITFDRLAARKLAEITRANLRGRLAFYVNDDLIISPIIVTEISGGTANLSGGWTRQQAEDVARSLNRPLRRP